MSIDEAAIFFGLSATLLLTELLNDRRPITAYAVEWTGGHVDELAAITKESDGSFVINEVEEIGARDIYSGTVQPLDSDVAIFRLVATGSHVGEIFGFIWAERCSAMPSMKCQSRRCSQARLM